MSSRLKDFIDQAQSIYYCFLLGDQEEQASYINGLFEHCLTVQEKDAVWKEVLAVIAARKAKEAKPDAD